MKSFRTFLELAAESLHSQQFLALQKVININNWHNIPISGDQTNKIMLKHAYFRRAKTEALERENKEPWPLLREKVERLWCKETEQVEGLWSWETRQQEEGLWWGETRTILFWGEAQESLRTICRIKPLRFLTGELQEILWRASRAATSPTEANAHRTSASGSGWSCSSHIWRRKCSTEGGRETSKKWSAIVKAKAKQCKFLLPKCKSVYFSKTHFEKQLLLSSRGHCSVCSSIEYDNPNSFTNPFQSQVNRKLPQLPIVLKILSSVKRYAKYTIQRLSITLSSKASLWRRPKSSAPFTSRRHFPYKPSSTVSLP